MSKRARRAAKLRGEYTAVRMERDLYEKAKRRAGGRRQTYSEYVRQLIAADLLNGNGAKLEAVS